MVLLAFFLFLQGMDCIPKENIVLLPYDSSSMQMMIPGQAAAITQRQFEEAQSLICAGVADYNKRQRNKDFRIMPMKRYRIQCVPYCDAAGHVIIWVQGIADFPRDEWKTQLQMVLDGGNGVFGMEIDLTDRKYRNVGINGFG